MQKHFDDLELAEEFVKDLYSENKWIIQAEKAPADVGGFYVKWQEHKKYTAQDGKEYFEEVWTTEAGEAIQIQDLSDEHAKNIIRMILRNKRLQRESYRQLLDDIQSIVANGGELDETADDEEALPVPDNVFTVKGNTTLN